MNIHVYIGTSGAGKTTLIEKNYFVNATYSDTKIDNMPVCLTSNGVMLLGHYEVDKRCKGCDTLSMSIIDKLIEFIRNHIKDSEISTIVVDGDRINNKKFFDFLLEYASLVTVFYLVVPIEIVKQRLPDCNLQFVQTTKTKSENIYRMYYDKLKFEKYVTKATSMWW